MREAILVLVVSATKGIVSVCPRLLFPYKEMLVPSEDNDGIFHPNRLDDVSEGVVSLTYCICYRRRLVCMVA